MEGYGNTIAVCGIVVTVLIFLGGCLAAVIGYFVSSQLKGIGLQLSVLPQIQIEMAGMQEKVRQNAEQTTIISARLGRVEEHVSNTERVALLEQRIGSSEREISGLRRNAHRTNEILGMVVSKLELKLPTEPASA